MCVCLGYERMSVGVGVGVRRCMYVGVGEREEHTQREPTLITPHNWKKLVKLTHAHTYIPPEAHRERDAHTQRER
jgi:hypothetical protein